MFRKIAALAILIVACLTSSAQLPGGSIRVIVLDSAGKQPLDDATISLLKAPAGPLLHRIRSRHQGFTFHNLAPGDYQLITSYLGYATDTTSITLRPADSTEKQLRILLHHAANAMMEVVVHANIPPAIVKNDTIAFNAGAFPTRPNATVEDLLRKLPGIDIDKNGNVTMQGQKVDKIYLDGKEFFLDDPRTATQNLPADIVDQIEAFDSQTERARLTGIREPTGTKTLNIKLKKNRKKGYFGKVYAGTGSGGAANSSSVTSSYSAGGTATNLGNAWLFGTGNLNNMNNQFTGADNKNGPGPGGVQTLDNLQLNFRNNNQKRLAFTFNGGTNGTRTTLDQTDQRLTTLADSSLLENRLSHTVSHNQSVHGNAYLEYTIDSFSLINLRSTVTPSWSGSTELDTVAIQTQKTGPGYLSNQGRTDNSNHSDEYNITNVLNFRQRWRRPGRTLYASLSESYDHQNQPQHIFSLVNNFDSTGNLLSQTLTNQNQSQLSKTETYAASVAYTEPLKPGHLLDFSYRVNRSISRSDRQADDFDSATGKYDRPDTLTTNHFVNYNTIQRLGAGYNATDGKYRYQIGLTLQFSDLDDHNLTAKSVLNQRQTNWYPRASLIYTPSQGKNIKLVYTANTTSPTIQQLQPLPDLTNPFLVRIGNPGLLQQLTHTLNAAYTGFNSKSFQNLQIALQANYTEHEITPSTTILSGGIQQIQYVNVDGVWHASSNITYGFPLGDQRKGNSSIGVRLNYGRDVSLLDGTPDVNTSLGWSATWKLNFHPVEKLFVEGVASVNYTNTQYSVNPGENTNTWLQNYSVDASYELPGAFTVASNYNLQITGPQGTLPSKSVALWNASIYKDLLRDRTAQIRFSAFGILNTVSNFTQTIGIDYKETSQTNLPGRILLLSFIYRFRHFPGQKPAAGPPAS
jgi:hypothetical protein